MASSARSGAAALLPDTDAADPERADRPPTCPARFIIMGVVAVILFRSRSTSAWCVGLMPVTGIPLPLLSYGGSSVLFTFLALGIVMNIRMRRFVN